MKDLFVPEFIKPGLKFKSKWFDGDTEVLSVNQEDNSLEVEITRTMTDYGGNIINPSHTENWNIQHTIWGFESGDYKAL